MKRILAIHGSPRKQGNSALLLQSFLDGARKHTPHIEEINPHELNLEQCRGCLRCNVLKRCSISGDDWETTSASILASDVLVLSSPIYFHHLPAPVKTMIDRFRSFVHVQITQTGLVHTPWQEWKKDFVLILCMGSPDPADAQPVIDLFQFMKTILGSENRIHVITATRLAMARQVGRTEKELTELYLKSGLSASLVGQDVKMNMEALEKCRRLGMTLSNN